jgi:HSP20 family molecular chaperone IbpA
MMSSNPFTLMRRMSEEMDRAFGQFFGETGGRAGSWYLAIEATERDGSSTSELPGLKPEDLNLEIAEDALTISGERESEEELRTGTAYRSERRYGQFCRENCPTRRRKCSSSQGSVSGWGIRNYRACAATGEQQTGNPDSNR